MTDAWMREPIPADPPLDPQERERMIWHMARTHYLIALDYQKFKPRLEAVVRTNEKFERAGTVVKLLAWAGGGLLMLFGGLYEAAQVWEWVKKHL